MMKISNAELAKRYKEKSRLLGKDILDVCILSDDAVMLMDVKDKVDTGRLVVPNFITDINNNGPLKSCKYTEIYVDNRDGMELDVNSLCRGMSSDKLMVEFRNPDMVVSTSRMFIDCKELKHIDISKLSQYRIRDMSFMFCGCVKLKSIYLWGYGEQSKDVSNLDMRGMFMWCSSLEDIDISRLNTKNAVSMSGLFKGCQLLRGLDLSRFDTSRVIDMSYMFAVCKQLRSIDVSSFKTDSLVCMKHMFNRCKLIRDIDINNFNTSKVKDMSSVFKCCYNLRSIGVNNIDTSKVENMESMFEDCIELEELDLSSWDTSKVTDMSYMFNSCSKLKYLNTSSFNIFDSNIKKMNMYKGVKENAIVRKCK